MATGDTDGSGVLPADPSLKIAIITADVRVDDRLRATLTESKMPCEIVSVPAFFGHQQELAGMEFAIVDLRADPDWNLVADIRSDPLYFDMPMMGIESRMDFPVPLAGMNGGPVNAIRASIGYRELRVYIRRMLSEVAK